MAELQNEKYIVCWRHKDGSKSGQGHPISLSSATSCVNTMNKMYPNIQHWVLKVD